MNLDKLLKKSHLASLSTENHWISLINGMGKGNLPWWGARFYPERDWIQALKSEPSTACWEFPFQGDFSHLSLRSSLQAAGSEVLGGGKHWAGTRFFGGEIGISHFHQIGMCGKATWNSSAWLNSEFNSLLRSRFPLGDKARLGLWNSSSSPVFVEIWGIYIQGLVSWLPYQDFVTSVVKLDF